MRVVEGKFLEADVKLPREGDYRVIFTADRAGPDGFVMYYWDQQYRDYVKKVREHYSKVKLGPGFRFLVDPLWNEMNTSHDFIPSGAPFAEQFTQWLKTRYGTMDKLNEAWRPIGGALTSFAEAGSTVSVERTDDKITRAMVQYVYSRSGKSFYTLDACRSQFNYDIREFIGRSLLHYCNDIADVFKKMNNVPVIYKCFSDVDWWHINDTGLASGHDGLGMESYGNGEAMLMFMAIHIFGEAEQATKTTWLIATETAEGNHQDVAMARNKPLGYTDRLGTMYANFNALISGGAKGIYHFNMIGGRNLGEAWSDNLSRDPRQLEWLATYDRILANAGKLVDYKPKVYYRYPALYHPCAGELDSDPCGDYFNMGGWWPREPVERAANNIWIVPTFSLRPETPMFIVNLENTPGSTRGAVELSQAIASGKRITMIGFRKDLGTILAVDKYYTDKYATNERGYKFQILRPTRTSKILAANKQGEVWNLIDGGLQINSEEVFGKHGYVPQNLVFGPEKPIDPYGGVFRDLLGVKAYGIASGYERLSYTDSGVPTTVISAESAKLDLKLPARAGASYTHAGGKPAGVVKGGSVDIALKPVDKSLVRAKYDWGPDGIMVDSLDATDTVVIRGVSADQVASRLPKPREEAGYYVRIEAERPKSHNFDHASLGGIPYLSGKGFLALETSIEPPKDTGWYATYEFTAPVTAVYQFWVRESYLSFSSPCFCKLDGGPWTPAPNTFVPYDAQMVTQYNPVEDTRQIFAWYYYGPTRLDFGKHTLTIKVTEPRPKGSLQQMAEDRPYGKMIDCIVLAYGSFVPEGVGHSSPTPVSTPAPMVNLLANPSVEFDTNGDGKCEGWTPSQDSGLEWTKPGWGNVKLEGLVDINLHRRDSYCMLRALKIEGGEQERTWTSDKIDLGTSKSVLAGGFVRVSDPSANAFFQVQWFNASGQKVSAVSVFSTAGRGTNWHEERSTLTPPKDARSAALEWVLTAGSKGTAWFDDMFFAVER